MVTRPSAINSSQCRRDPRPAAARKRLRRTALCYIKSHAERSRRIASPSRVKSPAIDSAQDDATLDVGLCLRQADHLVTVLPLTAFLEKLNTLEAFQHVALSRNGAGAL